MKRFFTLLVLLSSLFIAKAQDMQQEPYRGNAQLSISSFYGNNLRVIIDNKTYNLNGNGNNGDLNLNDLSAGNHSISIRRVANRGRGGYNSRAVQVLYDANIFLKANYQTDLLVNRFGRVFKDEQSLANSNTPYYPNQEGYPVYNQPMQDRNFDALKASVANESFDGSRLNLARQAAASNFFTSAQAKQLVQIFAFDNSRLEIAKNLYSRTVDKQNYFVVNDVFSFSSSRDELAKYILQNP